MDSTIEELRRGSETLDINKHLSDLGSDKYEWCGPATDLLAQLTIKALQIQVSVKSQLWPGAPHVLSRRLTEIRATLKEIGIDIEFKSDVGREKRREIIVTKIASPASPASPEAKSEENDAQNQADGGDATKEGDATSVSKDQIASLKSTKNRAQITSDNDKGDGRDARDATLGNNVSTYKCRHCDKVTLNEAEHWKHTVTKHPGKSGYPIIEDSKKSLSKEVIQ